MTRKTKEVSLDNGYTRIANELLELICKMPSIGLSGRFLLSIMRLTYGWHTSEKPLSRRSIMRVMGIKSCKTFIKVRDKLHNDNIVIHRFCGQRTKSVYKVNKEGVKILVSFYIGKGVKALSPLTHKRGHSKESIKKEKKEEKVYNQNVDNLGTNEKVVINIINTVPKVDTSRLKNDSEALYRTERGLKV